MLPTHAANRGIQYVGPSLEEIPVESLTFWQEQVIFQSEFFGGLPASSHLHGC
jgi:hypothetical protein